MENLLCDDSSSFKDYDLRVVGHSLGAAASVLVALFLRPKFPKVRAVAFEPPGCSVSYNLAMESVDWTLSFVVGLDVVPRFTYEAMADLRDEILVNIARIRLPKYMIHRNRHVHLGHDIEAVREFLAEALHDEDSIPETPFFEQVRAFRAYHLQKMEKRRENGDDGLFLPGRLVQLIISTGSVYHEIERTSKGQAKHGSGTSCCWADREDYRLIVLSPHFISDHRTATILSGFQSLSEAYDLQQPYNGALSHKE